jgi:hypothetical protein
MSTAKNIANMLESLLAKLPFDGDKTSIGAGIQILLPILVAKFPALLLLEPALNGFSLVLTGVGLMHKALKAARKK